MLMFSVVFFLLFPKHSLSHFFLSKEPQISQPQGSGQFSQSQGWSIMGLSKLVSHPYALGICSIMEKQNGMKAYANLQITFFASKIGSKMCLHPKLMQSKGRSHFCLITGQKDHLFSPACEQGISRLQELLVATLLP